MTFSRLALLVLAVGGCGQSAPGLDDMGRADLAGPEAADMAHSGSDDLGPRQSPPTGFWAACKASTDCRGYVDDQAPGFLGCYSYLGVDRCSRPCGGSLAACYTGASCTCTTFSNVSGFSQTDCYCAPN